MAKEYGKIIVIQDDTLNGFFSTDGYENCTFVFRNCTLINFEFRSRKNSIELTMGDKLCEGVVLDAPKVIMKEQVNTENLDHISINGGYFKMLEGTSLKAFGDIFIASDIQSLKKNKVESMGSIVLQSSYGTTLYSSCQFRAKYGIKVSALRGDLKIENSTINVTNSDVKALYDDQMNGVYLLGYGIHSKMYLLGNMIQTDVLEITHPNYMVVHNTELNKTGEYGRFLSRNQESNGQVLSHSYIEEETLLDHFYTSIEEEKGKKSKILELFKSTFKKVS